MVILFWILCCIYFLGWGLCCLSYLRTQNPLSTWGHRILILGFCLQLIFIAVGYGEMKVILFHSLSGLMIFLSVLIILLLFVLNFYFPDQIFELVFPPLTLSFLLLSVFIADQPIVSQEMMERSTAVGRSLLIGHGSLSMLGYLLFGVACLTSTFFLYQEKQIKNKTFLLKNVKIPSLGLLDTIIFRMIISGFVSLTVGLLLGIVMGVFIFEGAPYVTLRHLLPILTWAIYAVILISRSAIGIRGRNSAILSIIGFVIAVVSFSYEIILLAGRS